MNSLLFQHHLLQTRRQFFGSNGLRMGGLALAAMAGSNAFRPNIGQAESRPASPKVHPPLAGLPHFAAKARSIIYLHMNGGPSQIDTWDYKPAMDSNLIKICPTPFAMGNALPP